MSAWRSGAWRVNAWRAGSWRGMGGVVVYVDAPAGSRQYELRDAGAGSNVAVAVARGIEEIMNWQAAIDAQRVQDGIGVRAELQPAARSSQVGAGRPSQRWATRAASSH